MQSSVTLELYSEDELREILCESLTSESDEVMPFVCGDCESIGGYYAASFREISCPHCGGSAHPVNFRNAYADSRRPVL